jgi:hypothetical protein
MLGPSNELIDAILEEDEEGPRKRLYVAKRSFERPGA